MKKKIYLPLLAVALTIGLVAFISGYAGRSAAAPADIAASALPASDIVVTVDTQRLMSETLPTIFADNPALLARVNAKIEEFKTETGVDIRTFDSLAVGLRFSSPSGNDMDGVVVARGHFNSNQVIDASLATGERKGEIQKREEQYEGKTLYVITSQHRTKARVAVINPKSSGGGDGKVAVLTAKPSTSQSAASKDEDAEDKDEAPAAKTTDQDDVKPGKSNSNEPMAIVALDANTLAVGDLKSVKATIDASMGRARVDDELVRMATQNPSALVGFSGRVPQSMTEKMANGKSGGPEAKYMASIRQFYGSFSSTGTNLEALIAVRTENASQATDIGQALNAVKLLGGFSMAQPSGGEGRSLANLLKDLSITTQDNEVQIKLNVKQIDLAPFMHKF